MLTTGNPDGMSYDEAAAGDGVLVPPGSADSPDISLVLPSKDEEAGICECIERAKAAFEDLGVTGEIIVSDGSEDRTPDLAREHGALVVSPDRPGYGYAYRYAFRFTRGDLIAMADADTTYDLGELPALVDPILHDGADIVIGSRFLGDIKPGAMPLSHKYLGNPGLTLFMNRFYDLDVSDAHSGFRVFTRDALTKMNLQSTGFEFAKEMLMRAGTNGLTIQEVPITYHDRAGEATLNTFQDGWRHLRFMLENAPGYLFSIPGAVFGVVGVLVMVLAFFDITFGAVGFGVHSMIAGSLLTIVGYYAGGLGVFATVTGEAIRNPSDPITKRLVDRLSLERGLAAGLALTGAGGAYAMYFVVRWIQSGFTILPSVKADMVAFTAIVLGVQTVFASFYLSAVAGQE